MKWIRYEWMLPAEGEDGAAGGQPLQKALPYSELALQIAQEEAKNGNYTIEDDGIPDTDADTQTADEILNTLLGVNEE